MSEQPRTTTRRAVIASGVAGVTALVAGRLAVPMPTRAAAGDPLILGVENDTTGTTFIRNTEAGVSVFDVQGPSAGVGIRSETEGTAVFGQSSAGIGVWGSSLGTGSQAIAVNGASDHGVGVYGNSATGVAIQAEAGSPSCVGLQVLGSVAFDSAIQATIPARARSVTVAPVFGYDSFPLKLTSSTKVVCTLMSDPGDQAIKYVSVNPAANTFTVNLTGSVRSPVKVACLVLN